MANDEDERPTLEEWIERRPSGVSVEEAEKRYYERYGKRFKTHSPED